MNTPNKQEKNSHISAIEHMEKNMSLLSDHHLQEIFLIGLAYAVYAPEKDGKDEINIATKNGKIYTSEIDVYKLSIEAVQQVRSRISSLNPFHSPDWSSSSDDDVELFRHSYHLLSPNDAKEKLPRPSDKHKEEWRKILREKCGYKITKGKCDPITILRIASEYAPKEEPTNPMTGLLNKLRGGRQ